MTDQHLLPPSALPSQWRIGMSEHLLRPQPSCAPRGQLSSFAGLAARLIAGAVNQRRRRRAIACLEALDDRLLEDIGLARNDIELVVRAFARSNAGQSAVLSSAQTGHATRQHSNVEEESPEALVRGLAWMRQRRVAWNRRG